MPPSHAPNYYVLILPLAVLAVLMPQVFAAVTGALSVVEVIIRLKGGR